MQIFISHSHKDEKFAKELSSRLSAAGVKTWLAADEILPGENLSLEVGKALKRSDAIVVLLSPDAVDSNNVRAEISYALSSPKFEGRVIPVIVKPTKAVPWFLQTLRTIHSRGTHAQALKQLTEEIVESLKESSKEEDDVEHVLGEPKAVHG